MMLIVQPDEHAADTPEPAARWGSLRARRNRFIERYEQRRLEQHNVLLRPLRIFLGSLLILIGIAIGWLPGPGFVPFAVAGSFLLGSEVRRAAIILDRVEDETVPRIRRIRARLRGGPMPHWVDEHPEYWGITEDRRNGSDPDSGERRRRSDD